MTPPKTLLLCSAALLLAAAPLSAMAREDDFPRADDQAALISWLDTRTNIAAATVVTVTPQLVVALVGKTAPATPGGPVRLTLREEVIDAAYVDTVGGRSSLMSMEIQCEERRVRMDERRLYAGANLGGSAQATEPSSAWVKIPQGSIMDDVARAVCDTDFAWPLQSAQVTPQVTTPTVLAAASPPPPLPQPAMEPPPAPEIMAEPEPIPPVPTPEPQAPPTEEPPAPEVAVVEPDSPPMASEPEPPPSQAEEQIVPETPPPPEAPATEPAAIEPPTPALAAPEVTEAPALPPQEAAVVVPEIPPEALPPPEPPSSTEAAPEGAPAVEDPEIELAAVPPVPESPALPTEPVFAVQIGAYLDEESAQAAWKALSLSRPILVEGLRFELRPARVKGRDWLRGLVRDFASREQANAFCTAIAGGEYGCILRTLSD